MDRVIEKLKELKKTMETANRMLDESLEKANRYWESNKHDLPKDVDYISRQAAIDEIKSVYAWHDVVTQDRLIEHLRQLPSAKPKIKPHRNYEYLSDYWCKCGWHLGKKGDVNYCANCGRMVKWDEWFN